MKPSEKRPELVFRIIDQSTGEAVGSYSRACRDEYDFASAGEARNANCHGIFQDRSKYKIAKYRVTYELIEGDADGDKAASAQRLAPPASAAMARYEVQWRVKLANNDGTWKHNSWHDDSAIATSERDRINSAPVLQSPPDFPAEARVIQWIGQVIAASS